MILLNTTFSVDLPLTDAFISFIRETYIPLAEVSGLYNPLLTAIRAEPEKNMLTGRMSRCYALQLRAPSQQAADDFRQEVLPNLQYVIGDSWGMGVSMFDTCLDVVYDPTKDNGTEG